jgi:ABC-type multidrug transport system permease subunit
VFPIVFASSAFVPVDTFPSWLQPIAQANPVTIWVDTVRTLTLGELYTDNPIFGQLPGLGTLLWESTLWFLVILAVFVPLGVRVYRRT